QAYVGVGPGAHGRISYAGENHATENVPAPDGWLAAVASAEHGCRRDTVLTRDVRIEEMTMMGLRLRDGLDREEFLSRVGISFEKAFERSALETLTEAGLIAIGDRGLRATAAGLPVLDGVLRQLLA
ncbi:MAG: coproporphyrinogen III oxidase, partial [Alphaproteobacteria bacterium]